MLSDGLFAYYAIVTGVQPDVMAISIHRGVPFVIYIPTTTMVCWWGIMAVMLNSHLMPFGPFNNYGQDPPLLTIN
jgi:hypothetical protein